MPDNSQLPKELQSLAVRFLQERAARGLSPATRHNDKRSLARFVGWLERERPKLKTLLDIDGAVIADYALHLALVETAEGQRLRPGSRCTFLAPIATFFAWLEKEGKVFKDPARDLPRPKLQRGLPRGVLSIKEVEKLLGSVDLEEPLGLRDRAILEVLYGTGLRNGELRALELDDLDLAEGLVTVKRGKGGRGRVVPLGREAVAALEAYIEKERGTLRRSRFERILFLTRSGRGLQMWDLDRIVRRAGRRATLGKALTPHGLRHTCATHLLKGRADIRYIQALLGHRCLSSTQIYTHVAAVDLKRVHARCHPREKAR